MRIRPQVLTFGICLAILCGLAMYFGYNEVATAAIMGLGGTLVKIIEKD